MFTAVEAATRGAGALRELARAWFCIKCHRAVKAPSHHHEDCALYIDIPGYPSPQEGQRPEFPIYCPKCKAEVSDYQRETSNGEIVAGEKAA